MFRQLLVIDLLVFFSTYILVILLNLPEYELNDITHHRFVCMLCVNAIVFVSSLFAFKIK
jgi:hypothetical protein